MTMLLDNEYICNNIPLVELSIEGGNLNFICRFKIQTVPLAVLVSILSAYLVDILEQH